MYKVIAIVVLAVGLAACGVVNTLVHGFEYAKAVEDDLEQATGLKPNVGFNWSNGRLVSVTVLASGTLLPKPEPLEPIQGSFRSFHVPSGVRARLTSSVGSPRSSLGRISAPSNKFLVRRSSRSPANAFSCRTSEGCSYH